ncbi:MAG: DnaD domain protein, partial [Eubacteriales bacterium]
MTLANSNHTIEIPYSFIEEHLPYAPGDFIKVYLVTCYFAAYKKPLVSEIANRLNTRETEIITALEYWQNKGVLTIKNEAETWVELKDVAGTGKKHSSALYTDKDYNDALQSLFGTHILKTSEYELIYDWTDVLHLPKEVAMMVIEYSVGRKGRGVNISYMNAVAKSWAEKGVDSVEAAMSEIDRYERLSGGANRVLKYIGVSGRLPSQPEMALYQKWTMDWGFTLDAIIMAIGDISATTNPSFKYIDSVLKNLKGKGATTSRKVSETKADESKTRDEAKELLAMLGLRINQPNIKKIADLKEICKNGGIIK